MRLRLPSPRTLAVSFLLLGAALFLAASLSARLLAATAVGAGLLGILWTVLVPPRYQEVRLAERLGVADEGATAGAVAGGLVGVLDRVGLGELARNDLDRSGVDLPLGEFVTRAALVVIVLALLGSVASGPAGTLVGAALGVVAIRVWLGRRAAKRRDAFAEQLPGTLQSMMSSLRAGYSLPQSFDAVVEVGAAPTSNEFARLLSEVRVGRDLGDALGAVSDRVQNDDFRWVAVAVEINSEIGGDLSEVLETVSQTIRDRESTRRTVRSLSAEGRVSAITIIALPPFTFAALLVVNPSYVLDFIAETGGRIAIGVALGLMGIGSLWIRRIIRLRF